MKGKMPEITTGQTVLIAKQEKERKCLKIPFLSHFLFSLVCFVNIVRADEGLNVMLINIYQSQKVTFIAACLLPFTFSRRVRLLGQPLKRNASFFIYLIRVFPPTRGDGAAQTWDPLPSGRSGCL